MSSICQSLFRLWGGIVGGGFDAITTNIIGNYARDIFLSLADNYSCG